MSDWSSYVCSSDLIERDREADFFLRDQHHGGEGAEDGAAVPDDLLALIIGHGPAERIGVEIGLGGFEPLGQLPDRLDDERSPHLAGLPLAVEPPLAFPQLAVGETDVETAAAGSLAHTEAASRPDVSTQLAPHAQTLQTAQHDTST